MAKLRRKIMEQAGIVVVHKNKTLRSHLVNFLAQEGLKILADFDSLAELRANARASNPGVILLDAELLRDESEGYLEDLKQALPEVKLVLTGPDPQAHYSRHIGTLGADLYLSEGLDPRAWTKKLKAAAAAAFVSALRRVGDQD